MANLILWRHAEAEDDSVSGKDIDRALTKRGNKDANNMAKWLSQYLPTNTQILCSPARRCMQTATSLAGLTGLDVQVVEFLSVNSTADRIAKEVINDDCNQTIVIVGHQPNLGYLITKLLGLNERASVVKKGAVWWLRQRSLENGQKNALQTYLFTVQHPSHLV